MASSSSRLKVNPRDLIRCESQKVGFSTYAMALDAAERMMDLGHVKPGCHIKPYTCPACGEFHLSNHRIIWTGSVE